MGEPEITHWDGPPLEAWEAWHPREIAERLAGVGVPWCVVAGWAIDLHLGRETRAHADAEICIPRAAFAAVRAQLAEFAFAVVGDGQVRALRDGALPPPDRHQNWVLDRAAERWRLDVMLDPGDTDTWVCRRDPHIRAHRADVIGVRDGIPYLAPAQNLLFKAKAARPKDEADLAAALPTLGARERAWLAEALARVHPGHAWLARLT